MRLGDDDNSGLDVGETLPGSHDLWFHELENASFDDSRREFRDEKTALRSLAPLVAVVQSTNSRQRDNFRRG